MLKTIGGVVLVIVVVLGVLVFAFAPKAGTPEAAKYDAMHRESKGIAQCWESQARKSLDPGSARAVAAMCEGLEAKYVADYGQKP